VLVLQRQHQLPSAFSAAVSSSSSLRTFAVYVTLEQPVLTAAPSLFVSCLLLLLLLYKRRHSLLHNTEPFSYCTRTKFGRPRLCWFLRFARYALCGLQRRGRHHAAPIPSDCHSSPTPAITVLRRATGDGDICCHTTGCLPFPYANCGTPVERAPTCPPFLTYPSLNVWHSLDGTFAMAILFIPTRAWPFYC